MIYSDVYNIKYQPMKNVAYLNNAKVACSTIKNSLLFGKAKNVHEQFLFPQFNNPFAEIFSVVRNPYDRAVSAYIDKVGPNKDHWVWNPFCKRYGLDRNVQISFEDFLNILLEDNTPKSIDQHFRAQSYNLIFDRVTPRFIGHLENMEHVENYLKGHGFELMNRAPHKTSSSDKKAGFLTQSAIDKIERLYDEDFCRYNYEKDPYIKQRPEPIFSEQFIDQSLFEESKSINIEKIVTVLRESAFELEEKNAKLSLDLLNLLLEFRPDANFVAHKARELDEMLRLVSNES